MFDRENIDGQHLKPHALATGNYMKGNFDNLLVTLKCPTHQRIVLESSFVKYKQKHLGYKKVQDQSETILQTGRCDQKF